VPYFKYVVKSPIDNDEVLIEGYQKLIADTLAKLITKGMMPVITFESIQ
jgi:hypothetical protein